MPISLDIGTLDIGTLTGMPSHIAVALDDVEHP